MALKICPDCGRKVSDRARSCPECGCPSSFFIDETKPSSEKRSVEKVTEKSVTVVKEEKKAVVTFNLCGSVINYPQDAGEYARLFGVYGEKSESAYSELADIYTKASSMTNALEAVHKRANQILSREWEEIVEFLYRNGIVITAEELVRKYRSSYSLDFDVYFNKAKKKYDSIMENKNTLEKQRMIEQASRSRWQGGGFGVKGAIKGAATAGMLNMGSDILHSFGDAAQKRHDEGVISNQLSALHGDLAMQYETCVGIYITIQGLYSVLVKELDRIKYFKEKILIDEKQALALFQNAEKFDKDRKKFLKNVIRCIELYPREKSFYKAIVVEILELDKEREFEKFLNFWNINYIFPNLTEAREEYDNEKKEAEKFESYYSQNFYETKEIHEYNSFCMKLVYNYFKEYNVNKLPPLSNNAKKIMDFYSGYMKSSNDPAALTWFDAIEWISVDADESTFFNCIKSGKYLYKRIPVLDDFWIIGDEESSENAPKEKLISFIDASDDEILLYIDNSFMHNGKKGFALTKKFIIDLETNDKTRISNVREISVYDDGSLHIVSRNKVITCLKGEWKNFNNCLNFVAKLLIVFCVRYGNNPYLWNEKMSSPKPQNGKIDPLDGIETFFSVDVESPDINDATYGTLYLTRSSLLYIGDNYREIEIRLDTIKTAKARSAFGKHPPYIELGIKGKLLLTNITLKRMEDDPNIYVKQITNALYGNFSCEKEQVSVYPQKKEGYMFCPMCGKQIKRSVKFCNFCGAINNVKKESELE